MLVDESDYYCIHVRKTTEEPTLNNLSQNQNQGVPIKFELYSSTDNAWTMAEDDNFEHPVRIIQEPLDLITETTIRVPCASSAELLSNTGRHTVVPMVTEVLNTLNIPEHEHQSAIDKLFSAFLDSQDLTIEPHSIFVVGIEHVIFRMHFVNDYQMVYGLGVPFVPATASSIEGLEEVSVDGLDDLDDSQVSDDDHTRAMHQSMETYKVKFIPATASAIEGLEKVRVEGLGLGDNKVCVICMEGFEAWKYIEQYKIHRTIPTGNPDLFP
ncbi:hypothetical protein ACE6H2_023889 [Prunus campanulata]